MRTPRVEKLSQRQYWVGDFSVRRRTSYLLGTVGKETESEPKTWVLFNALRTNGHEAQIMFFDRRKRTTGSKNIVETRTSYGAKTLDLDSLATVRETLEVEIALILAV